MKTPNDETANGRLNPYLRGSILITLANRSMYTQSRNSNILTKHLIMLKEDYYGKYKEYKLY